MQVIDLQSRHHAYYHASSTPELVQVEGGRFVSILGEGSPGTDTFYRKKRALRRLVQELAEGAARQGHTFLSPPLEISYWHPRAPAPVTIGEIYTAYPLEDLEYRMMMRLPESVTQRDMERAEQNLSGDRQSISYHAELFEMKGGSVVQTLHIGPFANELQTLRQMQEFADSLHVRKSGPHHEIHLTDWEKGQNQDHLKTILRDPVTPA